MPIHRSETNYFNTPFTHRTREDLMSLVEENKLVLVKKNREWLINALVHHGADLPRETGGNLTILELSTLCRENGIQSVYSRKPNYQNLTLGRLKELLRSLKLRLGGTKPKLLTRLDDFYEDKISRRKGMIDELTHAGIQLPLATGGFIPISELKQRCKKEGISITWNVQSIADLLQRNEVEEGEFDCSIDEHRRLVWKYTLENRAGQQADRTPGNAIQQWEGNMAESLVRLGCGLGPIYSKQTGTDIDLEINDCKIDVKSMNSTHYNPEGFLGTGGYNREPKNNLVPPGADDQNDAYIFVRITAALKATGRGKKGNKQLFPEEGSEQDVSFVDGSWKTGSISNPIFRIVIVGWLSIKHVRAYAPIIPGGRAGGGISEKGKSWMHYAIAPNMEIYDGQLNQISEFEDIAGLTIERINNSNPPELPFLSTVDAHRVALGLLARGIISDNEYEDLVSNLHFQIPRDRVPTILQRSQYNVLLNWGRENDFISEASFSRFEEIENIWNEAENEEE